MSSDYAYQIQLEEETFKLNEQEYTSSRVSRCDDCGEALVVCKCK